MDELKRCKCGRAPIRLVKQSSKETLYTYFCTCEDIVYDFSKTLEEAEEKWNEKVSEVEQ